MKQILVGLALIVLVIGTAVTGCAKPALAPAPAPTTVPIRIGATVPLSGFDVEAGNQVLMGIKLAFEEINWKIADRPIELVAEDAGFDTAQANSKIRKMILSDKIDLLLGPYGLNMVDVGLRDLYADHLIVRVFLYANERMHEKLDSKYIFRPAFNGAEQISPLIGDIAYKEKGYRNAVCFAPQFTDGQGMVRGFKKVFEGLGGKVIQEFYAPLGCVDFAPYLIKVDVDNADVVYAFLFGGDAIKFVKQYAEYGLKERLPMLPWTSVVYDTHLPFEGDAALGIESVYCYTESLDTPENNRFKKAIWDTFEKEVHAECEVGYVAAKVAIKGLQAVNGNIEQGNIEQADALVAAIEKVSFEAPRGPFKWGPDIGQPRIFISCG